MAYNEYSTRFFFRFESNAGREFRIDIKKRNYTGVAEQRHLGQTPVLKRENGNSGIYGTSLEIYAECRIDGEFAELYTSDAKEFLVVLSEVSNGTTTAIWHGFNTPELYAEPEVAPPYDVQIIATDGLGELKLYNFQPAGRQTIFYFIQNLLQYSGLAISQSDVIVVDSLACVTPSVTAPNLLAGVQVDLDYLAAEGKNCYDVLSAILVTLNLTLTRYLDKWLIVRESDMAIDGSIVHGRTVSGTAVTLPVAQYGSMRNHRWYPVGRIDTDIRPAKNALTVALPFKMRDSMLNNPNLPNGTGWTYPSNYVDWVLFAGGERRPWLDVSSGGTSIYQDIAVEQYAGQLTLILLTFDYTLQGYKPSQYRVYYRLRLTSGGTTYWLKMDEDAPTWETTEQSNYYRQRRAIFSDGQSTSSIPVSSFDKTELSIPGLPATGTLRVEIIAGLKLLNLDSPTFALGGVYLLQNTTPGLKDDIVISNDARGSMPEVGANFGDAPYAPNALSNLQNILTVGSSSLTSNWMTSHFTGELLSVVSMDYALSVALPRLKAHGTVNVPTDANLPVAFVNPDNIPMLIETISWKILADDLDIELISCPAAEISILSQSISEMSEEEATSIGGSTAAAGSGGGGSVSPMQPQYFEPIEADDSDEIESIKALYDISIIQQEADEELGIEEITKNVTEILRHLSLKEADGETYLSSDIGFASDGFISGAGLSSGGGGGSAAAMATLIDVTLDNLAAGDVLRYDVATQHWVNVALNLGAAASYGIGQVVQGDTGLVTGGDVYAAIAAYLSAAIHFAGITTTALADGSTNPTVTIDGESYTARRGDEVIYGGKEFLWTGTKWQQLGDEESWALKTITILGTGYLTGGGSLEASRTIDISDAVKTKIEAGNTAYGWGDHALAGYASATALTAVSDRVTTMEGRTNWDDYLEIVDGNLHVKGNRGLYSDSFVSGGGLSQTSGGGGVNLAAVWASLTNAVQDEFANAQIASAHLTTALSGYATRSWVEGQGFLKVEDFDLLPLTTGLSAVSSNVRSIEEWMERPYAEEFRTDTLTTDFVNTQALLLNGRKVVEPVETTTLYDVELRLATASGSLDARIGALEYWTERPSMDEAHIESLTAHRANIGGAVASYIADLNALNVSSSLRAAGRLYIGTTGAYIELTSDGYLHTNRDFYSDGFVSGGGLSQTGGSSGISAQMMWELLATSTNEQVAASHLSTALANYATQQWVISQGYLTSADFDMLSVSMGLESAHKRIDSIEDWMERPAVDELYADMVNTRQLLLNGRTIGSIVTAEDLNSWSGSTNITKVGTITTGTWHGTAIANDYLANSSITLAGRNVSLGGAITTANMRYDLGISNVENTALSTWGGSGYISTVGTITSGVWHGSTIANGYLQNSYITLAGRDVSLGGGITTANMRYDLGISNVENTALSTWAGSTSITKLGTITTGTWHGSAITNDYLANSSITLAGRSISLGGSISYSTMRSDLSISNVENTALSTWGGSSYISTVGTITSGTWHGSAIANSYLANSSISIAGNSVSLGGTLSAQTLLTSLGLDSLYLSLGGGTLTGDLYLRGGNYGRHIYFGDGTRCYLGELTDDAMTLYGEKGINILTTSSSYGVSIGKKVNNVVTATPLTIWGRLNLTDASYIEYNSTNGAIYANKGIYSDGFISGGGLSQTSDLRLKKDIDPISSRRAWAVVSSLLPVEFRWRSNNSQSAGFVAQDVERILPFAVTEVGGVKHLQYDTLFTYGLAAIGSLKLEVESTRGRIDRLERRVSDLQAEVNRYKKLLMTHNA